MVYEENAWQGYDCQFRQAAAATPNKQWSKTDNDLQHTHLKAWQGKPDLCMAQALYTKHLSAAGLMKYQT